MGRIVANKALTRSMSDLSVAVIITNEYKSTNADVY